MKPPRENFLRSPLQRNAERNARIASTTNQRHKIIKQGRRVVAKLKKQGIQRTLRLVHIREKRRMWVTFSQKRIC